MSIFLVVLEVLCILLGYSAIDTELKTALRDGTVFRKSHPLIVWLLAVIYPINVAQDYRQGDFDTWAYTAYTCVDGVLIYILLAYLFYAHSVSKKNVKKLSETKE